MNHSNHTLNPSWNKDITLHPYQSVGVEFIKQRKKVLIADEPGLGKTFQALKACIDLKLTPMIIAPAYLLQNWRYEISKCVSGSFDYYLGSYSQTAPYHMSSNIGCIILDETYYIKNPAANRSLKTVNYTFGTKAEYVIMLNGSPITNRVPELYSQLWAIHPEIQKRFPTYLSFCSYFCKEIPGYQGNVRYDGIKRLPELQSFLKQVMIRRKVEDVLDLPKVNKKSVVVGYGDDKELQRAWEAFTSGQVGRDGTSKKNSSVAKSSFTAKYVRDMCERGSHPVVVYSDHPESVDKIYRLLLADKIRVRKIDISVPSPVRMSYANELQNGEIEVLVATIGCFKAGWTGTTANQMVFNDIPWIPEDLVQCCKRIHRIGQLRPVFYHFMVGSKVDEWIIKLVTSKRDLIKEVLDY